MEVYWWSYCQLGLQRSCQLPVRISCARLKRRNATTSSTKSSSRSAIVAMVTTSWRSIPLNAFCAVTCSSDGSSGSSRRGIKSTRKATLSVCWAWRRSNYEKGPFSRWKLISRQHNVFLFQEKVQVWILYLRCIYPFL